MLSFYCNVCSEAFALKREFGENFRWEKTAVTLSFRAFFRRIKMDIQIVTGFLGAGKTTFLNHYLPSLPGKTVVIENEFGDVGIDGSLIPTEVPVHEIYAGCICCSLAIDFRKGIKEIAEEYEPDHIVIEPSGVGRLSDIIKACIIAREREKIDLEITKLIAIIDAESYEDYAEGFGAFYLDQIEQARLLLLSNLDGVDESGKKQVMEELKKVNPEAVIYDGDWRMLESKEILDMVSAISDYEEKEHIVETPALPADKVFSSITIEYEANLSEEEFQKRLEELHQKTYGYVLRAKGIITLSEGKKVHFDYTPSVTDCREAAEDTEETGMIVIGCDLNKPALEMLFR